MYLHERVMCSQPVRDLFHCRDEGLGWLKHSTYSSRGVRVTEFSALKDTNAVSEISTLLTTIAMALVDDTAAVKVEVITSPDSTVLRLHVAPSDIGKLIGKQGRTARSLRTILGAASMKLQYRFSLDIVEAGRVGGPSLTPPDDGRD
jgi:predicted RNA-binding protein YlqC (UPF0109 family)